jgi:hypothetical protein
MNRHQFLATVAGIGLAALSSLAAAQAKPIELEFPSWQIEEPGVAEYWTELIKAFEAAHPNVKVKKQQVPFREYVDKLTIRFAGNNPPDIVHLPTRNYLAFASQSWQLGWIVGPAGGGFILQHSPFALFPVAAGLQFVAAGWALRLERALPEFARRTPRDSAAGMAGTMENMVLATDDPLSTGAQPSPHPADPAAPGGGRSAPASRTARR